MDFYHWLLKKVGMDVSSDSYFVYANADRYKERFDGTMHFNMSLKKYAVDDSWVETTLNQIRKVLDEDSVPDFYSECKNCKYIENIKDIDIKEETIV